MNLVVHQLTNKFGIRQLTNKLPDFMELQDLTPRLQCTTTRPVLK
jgi:hypothetical protein